MNDKLTTLKQIAWTMRQYIVTENEAAMQTALEIMQNTPALVAQFFSGALEELLHSVNAKIVTIRVYTDIKIEIAKKEVDIILSAHSMCAQTILKEFASEKFYETTQAINNMRTKFLADIETQINNAERYKHLPELYNLAIESINIQVSIYCDSVDSLLEGFKAYFERRRSAQLF